MITYNSGSIFECNAAALVNTVNCVGDMGAGLARAFAIRYPSMEQDYIRHCQLGNLRPGKLHTYHSNLLADPVIINFPTKDDWRHPSEMRFIEAGMEKLVALASRFKFDSVAVPALGCGLGGLEWPRVKEEIEYWVEMLPTTNWIVFPPQ